MKKNVAGQSVGAQMLTATDGSDFTGTVTVVITIDNGTQTASGGTAPAHEGNGYHSYTPDQTETDGDHITFTFTGSGAISVSVQVFTLFPQTVDNDTKISAISTVTPDAAGVAATEAEVIAAVGTAQTADHTAGIAAISLVVPDAAGVAATEAEVISAVGTPQTADHTAGIAAISLVVPDAAGVAATEAEVLAAVLTAQQVRDAMALATGETPATDSIDDKLDTIVTTQESQTPVEQTRTSDVVTTGTETGTSANTLLQDGTEWVLTSVSGGIDAELIFNIGTDSEVPSSYHAVAYFESGKGRVLQIQAFNFNQNAYENRGGVQNDSSSLHDITLGLTDSHVRRGQGGTPGVDGDVRIRFLYTLAVSGKVSAGDDWHIDVTHVNWIKAGVTLGDFLDVLNNANPQRNYPLAAITIDTENGTPGTEVGVNGTPGIPSKNLVDARILADALGFNRYVLEGFTTLLTLDQNYDNWQFMSVVFGGTVDGNGQSTDGSVFLNMQLEGAMVGEIDCTQCSLKGITTEGFFQQCTLPQAPSVTLTGNSNFRDCDSTLPGVGNPGVDANNVVGLSLSFTKYAGGLDLDNLDNAANVTVSGRGSLALTDAATTATVIVSGHMRLTGSLPTGIVLTDAARIDTGQLDEAVALIKVKTDEMVFTNTGELDANTKSINDAEVTGAGTGGDPWDGA